MLACDDSESKRAVSPKGHSGKSQQRKVERLTCHQEPHDGLIIGPALLEVTAVDAIVIGCDIVDHERHSSLADVRAHEGGSSSICRHLLLCSLLMAFVHQHCRGEMPPKPPHLHVFCISLWRQAAVQCGIFSYHGQDGLSGSHDSKLGYSAKEDNQTGIPAIKYPAYFSGILGFQECSSYGPG